MSLPRKIKAHPWSAFRELEVQQGRASHWHSPVALVLLFLLFVFVLIFIYLFIFIYGCVGSSFLREGFLQLRQAGATLHRGARASHHRGLSCCGAQAPDAQAQ